jgi:hypothetical protein
MFHGTHPNKVIIKFFHDESVLRPPKNSESRSAILKLEENGIVVDDLY